MRSMMVICCKFRPYTSKINVKIETKRLELGKEKSQTLCPTLKVYEEEMPKSDETKYLEDWITTDGLNNKNINERDK